MRFRWMGGGSLNRLRGSFVGEILGGVTETLRPECGNRDGAMETLRPEGLSYSGW